MKYLFSADHPPASTAGKTAAVMFAVIGGFQICLAAGAPWGIAAYGGANPGVLSESMRSTSAVAAGVYAGLAVVAGTRAVGPIARRRVLYSAAPVMALGVVMNLASPSIVERMIWTPVTAALAVTVWRAARGSLRRSTAS